MDRRLAAFAGFTKKEPDEEAGPTQDMVKELRAWRKKAS
jgi:hypothetical protein